ncbi:hypothetical protein JXM67_00220 [candidate division WOR-3 bacterium]|nr:hypothetical protein [candidate division WOR-3 bacterium]
MIRNLSINTLTIVATLAFVVPLAAVGETTYPEPSAVEDLSVDPVLAERLPGYFGEDGSYYYFRGSLEEENLVIADWEGKFTFLVPKREMTEEIMEIKEKYKSDFEDEGIPQGFVPERDIYAYVGEDEDYYLVKAKEDENGYLIADPDGDKLFRVLKSDYHQWLTECPLPVNSE